MTRDILRKANTTSTATINVISLNVNTSTKISDAITSKDRMLVRLFFEVSNNSPDDIWLKLQPAATDDDKKGRIIKANGGYWRMPTDNVYMGEISAISITGTPDLCITEY